MKYSRLDKKKPYESPRLKLHTLRMEVSVLQGVTGFAPDQPWGARKMQGPIEDDSYTEQESTEYEYDDDSFL